MNILSVCTNLSTRRNPLLGLFVRRRLESLAEYASVRALIPQPSFPILRPRIDDSSIPSDNIQIDCVDMFHIPGVPQFNGRFMKRCVGDWLDSLGQKVKSDAIVDAHFGYPEGVGAYWAAKERGLPVFITIRGLEVDLFRTRTIGPKLTEALCGCDGVISVSQSLKDVAVVAGVPADHITVIPNGVDSAQFSPGDQQAAREIVGYHESKALIVSVGNLKPVKGHDVLVRAIARITCQQEIELICIGGGVQSSWGQELQSLVRKLGIEKSVRFVGAKQPDEVVHWLRAADLFALASHREGCCNAVLESLATGTPVVVTDAGDNWTLVHSPECGTVVPTNDQELMAEAILTWLSTDLDRQSIAQSVRSLNWSNVGSKVLQLFNGKISDAKPELALVPR